MFRIHESGPGSMYSAESRSRSISRTRYFLSLSLKNVHYEINICHSYTGRSGSSNMKFPNFFLIWGTIWPACIRIRIRWPNWIQVRNSIYNLTYRVAEYFSNLELTFNLFKIVLQCTIILKSLCHSLLTLMFFAWKPVRSIVKKAACYRESWGKVKQAFIDHKEDFTASGWTFLTCVPAFRIFCVMAFLWISE